MSTGFQSPLIKNIFNIAQMTGTCQQSVMSTFAVISTSGLSFDKHALKLSATAKLVVRTNSSGAAKCLTSRSKSGT